MHMHFFMEATYVHFLFSDTYRHLGITDGVNYNAKKSREKSQFCQFIVIKNLNNMWS